MRNQRDYMQKCELTEKEKENLILIAIHSIIIEEPDSKFAKFLKQLFG